MDTKRFYLTEDGVQKLKKEQEDLLKNRPHVISELQRARELGDLSENGLYKASRGKLSSIDSRLRYIGYVLKRVDLITNMPKETVQVGSKISLKVGGKTIVYELVGSLEADPGNGKISNESPLGKKLLNRKKGDLVVLSLPENKIEYQVLDIA